jgi:hypothetical protein
VFTLVGVNEGFSGIGVVLCEGAQAVPAHGSVSSFYDGHLLPEFILTSNDLLFNI